MESIGLSVQEKKDKIDFQDGHQGDHLEFSTEMLLATFDLQVALILPTKFRVNRFFNSGVEVQNRFQGGRHGVHHELSIGKILATFY